jgi:hypothetical protein
MNTVCFCYNEKGDPVQVASVEPIRCILVNEYAPRDRCYELQSKHGVLQIGADKVQAVLGDDPIWNFEMMAATD